MEHLNHFCVPPMYVHQVELMRYDVAAHRHSKENLALRIQERNREMVAMRLRLEHVKRHPGALDLEDDPVTELCAERIVRDKLVMSLTKENAELVSALGDLKARLARDAS